VAGLSPEQQAAQSMISNFATGQGQNLVGRLREPGQGLRLSRAVARDLQGHRSIGQQVRIGETAQLSHAPASPADAPFGNAVILIDDAGPFRDHSAAAVPVQLDGELSQRREHEQHGVVDQAQHVADRIHSGTVAQRKSHTRVIAVRHVYVFWFNGKREAQNRNGSAPMCGRGLQCGDGGDDTARSRARPADTASAGDDRRLIRDRQHGGETDAEAANRLSRPLRRRSQG
jgi:hypothetical protein